MNEFEPSLDAYLTQVGHAYNMVAELHGWLSHPELANEHLFHPWHALVDSWLVNARLLAEFYLGARRDDVDATTYLPAPKQWRLADDASTHDERHLHLTDLAQDANKHALHLARSERIAVPLYPLGSGRRGEALDLLFALGDRLAASASDGYRETLTAHLATAQRLRRWPPPVLHPGWVPTGHVEVD